MSLRLPLLCLATALVPGCDDECPGPATVATSGTATWCETAQGVRSGAYSVVDDGVTRIEGNYVAGEEDGDWAWYWPDGSLHERGVVRRGERVGDWERHAEDGTILPLTRYGRATTETEGVVLDNAHPDPSVFRATWLGAPVWTPSSIAGLVLAPQATGIVAIDPESGEVVWQVDSPSRLTDRPLGDGLRTAVAFTERGGVLVARLGDDLPAFQVYELGAAAAPEPVANDFGVVYVDDAGVLHDHAFEDAFRPVPDLIPTVLAVAGDRLILGTDDGTVAQWDRVAGAMTWSTTLDGPITDIAAPNWELVMVESEGTWFGLDFTTGAQRWEQSRLPHPPPVPFPARLDHPSAPLVAFGGSWVGTRAGLLVQLLDLPIGSPEHGLWDGEVLTSLTVGDQVSPNAPWESWRVPSVGATRTALPLGDQRGAQTTLDTYWFDLPAQEGSRQLTWPVGWEHSTARAWQMRLGDVHVWTQQTPPPPPPTSGEWVIDGWAALGNDWVQHTAITITDSAVTAGGWSQPIAETESTPWRATTQTHATWSGVPVAPWIPAWTASPNGWEGWRHLESYATTPPPEPEVIESISP